MWQRFDEASRRVICQAEHEAAQTYSEQVETGHLRLGLFSEANSAGAQILQDAGVTAKKVRTELAPDAEAVQREPKLSSPEIQEFGARFQVDPALIRQLETQLLRKLRGQSGKPELELSPQVKRVLELAAHESRRTQQIIYHANTIGTGHLLLGLLREEDSPAAKVLYAVGLTLEQTRAAVIEHLQTEKDN